MPVVPPPPTDPASDEFAASCRLRKHSVSIAGHRTSVSLEAAFWEELKRLAAAEGVSVAALIESIDRGRAHNLSGALRVYVLQAMRARAGY